MYLSGALIPIQDFLRYRQIQLGFYTSEQLTTIGGEFDAGACALMLSDSHVDLITCCAGGRQGMIFYDRQARLEGRRAPLQRKLVQRVRALKQTQPSSEPPNCVLKFSRKEAWQWQLT